MCNVLFTIDFSGGNGYFKLFLSDEYLLWSKIRYFISGFCDLVIMGGNTLLWLYFISRIFQIGYQYNSSSEKKMDIIIYLYHNSRFFYDMDIPANSGICNECDNRICIKLIDIVMWILRRDTLYAGKEDYGHSH